MWMSKTANNISSNGRVGNDVINGGVTIFSKKCVVRATKLGALGDDVERMVIDKFI